MFGATVISWKAREKGGPGEPIERIFVSSKAILDGSKAIRGGIPVVFPCFGPPEHPDHSKLPQHGFARNEFWTFDSVVMDNDAGVSVRLSEHRSLSINGLQANNQRLQHYSRIPTSPSSTPKTSSWPTLSLWPSTSSARIFMYRTLPLRSHWISRPCYTLTFVRQQMTSLSPLCLENSTSTRRRRH